MGSSRSPEPIPFDKAETQRQDSFGSDFSEFDKEKEHPRSTSGSWFRKSHTNSPNLNPNSNSNTSTNTNTNTEWSHKTHSPTVNLYTHCGRHTDQYLFGGHSFRELLRRKS
ncbi:hypothetical protein GGS20DRAFT_583883 [Poronia punctata]|nr:hypothetical protein GGS20DRAFT_583883 [Poronia punctata]